MVGEISARHALSKEVIEGVSERTGGVPLFVEEVTRLLVERGEQGGVQAIPPTLQQSLAARLDRLGAAREVAQIGAVLGRDFAYALLRDVAETRRAGASSIIGSARRRRPPVCRGRAAAGQLSLQARADPGRGLREPAQEPPPGAASPRGRSRCATARTPEPEAIAHHFTEAGLDDLAIEWWGKAGDQALRRSAFQEAIAHLGKAIEMADKAGATARRAHRRLGRSEPATDAIARRLRQRALGGARLRRAGNDGSLRQSPRVGVWRQGCAGAVGGRLRPMGRQLHARRVAIDAGARGGLPQRRRGEARFARGRRRPSRRRDHLLVRRRISSRRGIIWNARSPCSNPAATTIWPFASDPTPASRAMAYLAIALWPLGEVDRAISLIDRMQTRIADLTHVGTLAVGRCTRPCSN